MRLFITGATGFVGRATLRRLSADGHEIVAAHHRALAVEQPGVRWVQLGSLDDMEELRSVLGGTEVIVHLAALAHLPASEKSHSTDDFMRINRDGTVRLAQAAAEMGVRRFVYLSSVKACGESSGDHPLREQDSRHPEDAYGASKSEAEDGLAGVAAKTGMEHVVLRPPLVYGPGVRANFLSLLRWIDRGMPLPLAAIDNRRSLVYVGNLADALASCVHHSSAAGDTFFVSDGHDVSTAELVRGLGHALGRPARLFPVPLPLLRAAAAMAGRSAAVDRLSGSLAVDISRIRRELAWSPPCSLAEGLRETASWYRASRQSAA